MITVYTPNFERVGTITDNESSLISKHFYGVGDFEIYINKNKKYTESLVENNIVQFGNSKTDAGIITHRSLNRDELGKNGDTLFIKGFTLEKLVYNRVIVPPTGQNYMSFEGNQEYIMKQFVYHNLINAEDKDRNIPLKLSKDKGLGKFDRWRGRYNNLGELLNEIGLYSNLGWEVSLDIKNKCFIFDVKKGVNRQNNNKIRPPIIFEVSFGNVFSREFIEDSTNSKNVVYGGGAGAYEEKIFQKVGKAKGIRRVEGYQDFSNTNDPIELKKYIENSIKELQTVRTFNVEVSPDKPFKYGKDYFLGDYVTVLDQELGIKLNTQVTKVTKYDQGLSGIDITFGKDILSFIQSSKTISNTLVDIPNTTDINEPKPPEPGVPGKDGVGLNYHWNETKLGIKREDEEYFNYVDLKGDKGQNGLDGKDGISLDYKWLGTKLGIKKSNEDQFNFVNLKGEKGDNGERGAPGSDATVTKDKIINELGYTPANLNDLKDKLNVSIFNNFIKDNNSTIESLKTTKADEKDIPKLISQLKNDTGFITKKEIGNLDTNNKVFLNDNIKESDSPSSFSDGVTISNNGVNKFPTIGVWGMAVTFKPTGARATQLYITKDGELWGRRASGSSSWAKWKNNSRIIKDELNKDSYEIVARNGKFYFKTI